MFCLSTVVEDEDVQELHVEISLMKIVPMTIKEVVKSAFQDASSCLSVLFGLVKEE